MLNYKQQLQQKNANLYIQFLQYIAITTFETEISNFFAIDFSKTSLAKEPSKYYANLKSSYFDNNNQPSRITTFKKIESCYF